MALTPLADKKMESTKTEDNKPPRGFGLNVLKYSCEKHVRISRQQGLNKLQQYHVKLINIEKAWDERNRVQHKQQKRGVYGYMQSRLRVK